ncbi:MAG: alpha/beta hydrolase [Anaerolineales bacterium]
MTSSRVISAPASHGGRLLPSVIEHFIELPLTRLHYVKCGDGPPLIMVPATISRVDNWLPLLQYMGKYFTTYFFELPGHGESTPFAGRFTTHKVAETVRDLADALGHENISLMGFSFGGLLTMRSLALLGDRVDKVVLHAPALSYRSMKFSRPRRMMVKLVIKAMRQRPIRNGFNRLIRNKSVRPVLARLIKSMGKIEENVDAEKILTIITPTTCEVMANQFDEVLNLDLPAPTERYSQDCFFSHSINDPMVDYETALSIVREQFSKVHTHQLITPYHQPPKPPTYEEIEGWLNPLLGRLTHK